MEFLKSNTVKVSLNAFFHFPAWGYAYLSLNFYAYQPIYAYNGYAYKKTIC